MIVFQDVCKTYRVARREAGFVNAAKSLFKREYCMIHAINHISFSINDGEMVGLLGPNGAGKSSTIKILSGILTPDSGTCLVNGRRGKTEKRMPNRLASFSDSARNCGGIFR